MKSFTEALFVYKALNMVIIEESYKLSKIYEKNHSSGWWTNWWSSWG